VQKNFIA